MKKEFEKKCISNKILLRKYVHIFKQKINNIKYKRILNIYADLICLNHNYFDLVIAVQIAPFLLASFAFALEIVLQRAFVVREEGFAALLVIEWAFESALAGEHSLPSSAVVELEWGCFDMHQQLLEMKNEHTGYESADNALCLICLEIFY